MADIVQMNNALSTNVDDKKDKLQDEILQLVTFSIGNEEFGVEILKVQEINKMMQVTKIPNSPSFVEGVINLRGKVIPIINLRNKLRLSPKEHDKNTRIIVMEIQGKTVGFIVDAVSEVLRIPRSITEPPPPMIGGVSSEYIVSVGKLEDRLLILLDVDRILSNEEKSALANMPS
ncbi:MAG TPA: chemotaxis protein CheW [Ignavibacteriales bacterium]|nr:chemotaxis protein CheW [Ignavibacteriales bacterium]